MIKFALKCVLCAVVCGLIYFGFLAYRIALVQNDVAKEFMVAKDTDIVFVGSSQIGCGICTNSCFHNKKLWASSSGPVFARARVMELDRRHQLENVHYVVVPLIVNNINHMRPTILGNGFARQIPFMWRYVGTMPSLCEVIGSYINEYSSLPFTISEQSPVDPPSVRSRDVKWIEELPINDGSIKTILNPQIYRTTSSSCWVDDIEACFRDIKHICDSRNIKLIVLAMPLTSFARRKIPDECYSIYDEAISRIRNLGIKFIDKRESMPDESFFDYWHLIPNAAEQFTKMLYAEMGWSVR